MSRYAIKISAAGILVAALVWTAGIVPARAQRGFSGQRGVTLYSDSDFRGSNEVFTGDLSDLRRSRVGSDRASSVRVDPGCRAFLYTEVGFRGRSMEVTYDIPTLGGSAVGNDSVSSLRVDCEEGRGDDRPVPPRQPVRTGGPDRSGVTIFWRDDFHGRSHFFHRDHPNLGSTAFGHDQASSIILDQGCRVTLYEHVDYRGRSVTLTGNERYLGQTSVGDNLVSSLQVNCR
ncbi:MAG: beta/gamma crystallin-related protein [Thermoanaerobaculia bacterium]